MRKTKLVDPQTFAVIQAKTNAIALYMKDVMLMASRSAILTAAQDFSVGILDKDGNPLVTPDLIPIQMMCAHYAIYAIIDAYKGDIHPGDLFANNSPYHGNTHIQEITQACPVFYKNKLLFWTYMRPHNQDIGCPKETTGDAWAKDVYNEGLHIPPYRIASDGKLDLHFLDVLCENIRYRSLFRGDYLAGIGSIRSGEKQLIELCDRYGVDVIEDWIAAWQDYGDQRMTKEIRKLPKGTWYGETKTDPYPGRIDNGITIKLRITIDPDEATITIDGRDSDDQTPFATHTTRASFKSACMEGLFLCLDSSLPRNWGSWKHVKFLQREGSVCDPKFPAATMIATTLPANRIANLVTKIMSEINPEGGCAEMGIEGIWFNHAGKDWRRDNTPFGCMLFVATAGGGATMGYDGWPNMMEPAVMGTMRLESTEVHEQNFPELIKWIRMPPDSGGYGKWIGGPGAVMLMQPRHTTITMAAATDGCIRPSMGVLGGGAGLVNMSYLANPETGELIHYLDSVNEWLMPEDKAWVGTAPGGGGFGDPLERDPEAVRKSTRERFTSLQAARDIYGVVLNTKPEEYAVDYEATEKLRGEMRKTPLEERMIQNDQTIKKIRKENE